MLEKRKSLLAELDSPAQGLYAKNQFKTFLEKFSDLIPNAQPLISTLGVFADCDEFVHKIEEACKAFDTNNQGNEQSQRFKELRQELKVVSNNIKGYSLRSAQNIPIEDIRFILAGMALGEKFENRSSQELFDFVQYVHDTLYLGSCTIERSAPKDLKTSALADSFYKSCHAWPVKVLGKLKAREAIRKNAEVVTLQGVMVRNAIEILKTSLESFPEANRERIGKTLDSLAAQISLLTTVDPRLLGMTGDIEAKTIEELRSSFKRADPKHKVVWGNLVGSLMSEVGVIEDAKQKEGLTSLLTNFNSQIMDIIDARVMIGRGLEVVEAQGFTALQAAQMMKFIYNFFEDRVELYHAVMSELTTLCLETFIKSTTQTEESKESLSNLKAAKSVFVENLRTVALEEDKSETVEKFLGGILKEIDDYSFIQQLRMLIGLADFQVKAEDENLKRITDIRNQIVDKIVEAINKKGTEKSYSIPAPFKRHLVKLPDEVRERLPEKFKNKAGEMRVLYPQLHEEIRDVAHLQVVLKKFVQEFGGKESKQDLPSQGELNDFLGVIADFYKEKDEQTKKQVVGLFHENVLRTFVERQADVLKNWDLNEFLKLIGYLGSVYNLPIKNEDFIKFLKTVFEAKIKDELQYGFSSIVKVWNQVPRIYSEILDPIFKQFAEEAAKNRWDTTNLAADFFVECSNLLASAKITDAAKKRVTAGNGKDKTIVSITHRHNDFDQSIHSFLQEILIKTTRAINSLFKDDKTFDDTTLEAFKLAVVQTQNLSVRDRFSNDILRKMGIKLESEVSGIPRRSKLGNERLWAQVEKGVVERYGQSVGINYLGQFVHLANTKLRDGLLTNTTDNMTFFISFKRDLTLSLVGFTALGNRMVSLDNDPFGK